MMGENYRPKNVELIGYKYINQKVVSCWSSITRFSKIAQISNFMEIRAVGTELFHDDGQKDVTKLIFAFRNFAYAPKNLLNIEIRNKV